MKFFSPARFLVFGFLILSPSILLGQKGLKLGVIALPQNTWLINADDWNAPKNEYDHKLTFGMSGGLLAGWHFGDGVGLKLNFLYSLQGQKYASINDEKENVENNIRLQYFKIPLMISFNSRTEYSKVIFSFGAGIQAGFLTRARFFNNDQSYTPDQILYANVLDYPSTFESYKKFVYGPVAEFGFDIKLTYNIMANLRLRGDYMLFDSEDKNQTITYMQNGIPYREFYWGDTRPETKQITAGILVGLTYTFTEF